MTKQAQLSLPKSLSFLLSQGFRAAIALRHFAYDQFLKPTQLSIPVISVGNVVVGGTGKTPAVRYLAEFFSQKKKVAILSRGYKRKSKKTVLVKEGMSSEISGDEPLWLANKVPDAHVIVGADRVVSAKVAEALKAELILLDDGMQHRRIGRDIEIVTMHVDDLWGGGFYLPHGLLRDNPKRLRFADLILLQGIEKEEDYEKVRAVLKKITEAPITVMQSQIENGSEFASQKVGSFCAIAKPKRFEKTLHSLGCTIIEQREKPDHEPFSADELQRLANLSYDKGAHCLVCTEKDAVKLPQTLSTRIPICPVKTHLVPTIGKEYLEKMIKEVLS